MSLDFAPWNVEPDELETPGFTFTRGGSFILDTPPDPLPVWGQGQDVLMAEGEALIIAGGQGLGKTTLAQQLTLGRCGFPEYVDLLGFPIAAGAQRVLYLAMDRPRQAARSMRRMVGESWRDDLNDRLMIWPGPPPADLAKHPSLLLTLCRKAGADTVVIDSLKDAAIGLTDDEVGAGYNRARQTAIAADIQVVELHHNRKSLNGTKGIKPGIDDLYGSTWLPSGAGSVLLLSGSPGDPIVGLHHVKQPASEVGPMRVIHDHESGRSTVWHEVDVVTLASRPGGISAVEAACLMYDTEKPTPSEKEKARRKLASLERAGSLTLVQVGRPDRQPAREMGPEMTYTGTYTAPLDRAPLHGTSTPTRSPRFHAQPDLHGYLHGLHASGTYTLGGVFIQTPECVPDRFGGAR